MLQKCTTRTKLSPVVEMNLTTFTSFTEGITMKCCTLKSVVLVFALAVIAQDAHAQNQAQFLPTLPDGTRIVGISGSYPPVVGPANTTIAVLTRVITDKYGTVRAYILEVQGGFMSMVGPKMVAVSISDFELVKGSPTAKLTYEQLRAGPKFQYP